MIKNLANIRVIAALLLIALLVIVLISACNAIGIGGAQEVAPSGPSSSGILAPRLAPGERIVKALAHSPVQIQSAHVEGNISRVELLVKEPGQETEKLLRSDVPINGLVLREWVPQQAGTHTIKVRAFSQDQQISEHTLQIEVVDSRAISVEAAVSVEIVTEQAVVNGPVVSEPAEGPPGIATPILPSETGEADSAAAFEVAVVSMQAEPTAAPTPIRRYPPPGPAPGVPPGPTQAQLPNYHPPVCDAAEFLEIFTSGGTVRRIYVPGDDDVPVKVAAGTTVHRAWRLRNIGTCTWGPGYELSFYGGRSMGSGGVAFESPYPSDPGRRNVVVDTNRLIVPEGKPNQTAVLEVLLNTPTVPGVHQSYWRMRNPHGVYFGPILGVTMEVVRDCKPEAGETIYGAPTINRFRILGVDSQLAPEGAGETLEFSVQAGKRITLDWDIINATNFDIVLETPTGDVQTISSGDPRGRANFTPTSEVGDYLITLFADNGSCTVEQQLKIKVVPPENEQFILSKAFALDAPLATSDADASFSANVAPNTVKVAWNHFDAGATKFSLVAQGYKRVYEEYCPLFDSIFGWKGHCYMRWSDWKPTDKVLLEIGGKGDAQGSAVVSNIDRKLCPSTFDPSKENYRIVNAMRAEKNGRPASPEFSNTVEVLCQPSSGPALEIPGE